MLQNIWVRAGLGALVVFGVTYGAYRALRNPVKKLADVHISDSVVDVPVAFVPFTLDGTKLGTFKRVRLEFDQGPQGGEPRRVEFTVGMDGALPDSLAGCLLTARGLDQMDERTTFTCVKPADTAGGGWREVGFVEFDGTGTVLPLVLDSAGLRELRTHRATVKVGIDVGEPSVPPAPPAPSRP